MKTPYEPGDALAPLSAEESIVPFRIEIPESDLSDLIDRLSRTRWPDELEDAHWDYGIPLTYMKKLSEYWRDSYSWRTYEARLNRFPQYTTTIDGQNIHFLHVRSPEPDAIPLILTHGWPGSIVEFMHIIEPLTDPRRFGGNPADAFHLVIPSLPGFGFSGHTKERGWNVERVARAWDNLMLRLGYARYGAQGGDTGSMVSAELGRIAPDRILGVHCNGLAVFPTGDPAETEGLSETEQTRYAELAGGNFEGSGYAVLQATRPQTLSYGLTDSPTGQLAWIAEKFKEWTDPAAELPEQAVDLDLLLTNVSIYWLTATAGSSARIYKESSGNWGVPASYSQIPTGVAVFPKDLSIRRLVEREYNVVHWSEFEQGGHFAALEAPDLLTDDIRMFFRKLR